METITMAQYNSRVNDFVFNRLTEFVRIKETTWTELEEYMNTIHHADFTKIVDKVVSPENHSSNFPRIRNFKILRDDM